MQSDCGRGTFGPHHTWVSWSDWLAAVRICLQNGICHQSGIAGSGFGRRHWDTFGVAMIAWVIGEDKRGIALLDGSHFRLPLQHNWFLSLIQSRRIPAGHLTGGWRSFPSPVTLPINLGFLWNLCAGFPKFQSPLVSEHFTSFPDRK